MRRVSRLDALFAALAVAAAALAACTGGGSNNADDVPADIRGTTLTIFSPQGADMDLSTNSATAAVKSALGIDITWQVTPYDGKVADQERRESLTSANPPDVYLLVSWLTRFSQLELQEYGGEGLIVPLNDLIDKYAPNVKKAFADTPAWKRVSTAPDGKIYGLPQWNDCLHCSYGMKLWMNSAWLKKLGLQQPKTTEDLRGVLRAFKTRDPNGNGKADEIPLTGINNIDEGVLIPYLMNAFLSYQVPARADMTPLVLNHGKVQFQPAQDAYRKGLEYIASLYAEGLIDKAAFTQSFTGLKAEGDAAGVALVGAAGTLHPANIVTVGQKDGRDKQYDAVPPLTGPDGVNYAAYGAPGWTGGVFVISSKTTKTERIAAIKLLDYLVGTEGHMRTEFGEEGRSWVRPGAGDQALDPSVPPLYKKVPLGPNEKPRNDNWDAIAQVYSPASFRNAQVVATDIYSPGGYERRLFQATKLYVGKEPKDQIFSGAGLWLNRADTAEITQLQTGLQEFVAQNEIAFITGQKKLDVVSWAAYLDGLRGLGLQRYLGLFQKAYDAMDQHQAPAS